MSERVVWNQAGVDHIVARKTGVPCWLGPSHSIGFYIDNELKAAAVFDAFTAHECCMHLWVDGIQVPVWVLRQAFGYPFTQLGLKRITGLVRSDNEAALAIARRNGFIEEGRKRMACGECDEVVMGLLATDCEHLK